MERRRRTVDRQHIKQGDAWRHSRRGDARWWAIRALAVGLGAMTMAPAFAAKFTKPSPAGVLHEPGDGAGEIAQGTSLSYTPRVPTTPLTVLHAPLLSYPKEASLQGIQGRVILRVRVGVDGRPADAEVARSSGHALLDSAALEQVKAWRFKPATEDGKPVPGTVSVPVIFQME